MIFLLLVMIQCFSGDGSLIAFRREPHKWKEVGVLNAPVVKPPGGSRGVLMCMYVCLHVNRQVGHTRRMQSYAWQSKKMLMRMVLTCYRATSVLEAKICSSAYGTLRMLRLVHL